MNYKKIYDQLIAKAQAENRKKLPKTDPNYVYYEAHHIVPKCMNGSNDASNIVNLMAREHYIAHILLAKTYENTQYKFQLLSAVTKMQSASSSHNGNRNFKFNSRLYDAIKQDCLIARKEHENNRTPEQRALICKHISENHADVSGKNNPMYGHSVTEFMTDEEIKRWKHNLSLSNSGEKNGFYGKKHSVESIQKIKDGQKRYLAKHNGHGPTYGKKLSDATRKHLSEIKRGVKYTHDKLLAYNTTRITNTYGKIYDLSEFDFELYITLDNAGKAGYRKQYFASCTKK